MRESPPVVLLRCIWIGLLSLGIVASLILGDRAAEAGGQGTSLPPTPLPVRATELSIQLQARMVCIADPNIVCNAPYLDAGSNSVTTAGGTFRSLSCPGSNPPGACRPDFIPGAELTGELVDTWDVVITPIDGSTFDSCNSSIQTCVLSSPPPGCILPPPGTPFEFDCDPTSIGGNDDSLICHGGKLELNVSGPGVVVANPLISFDPLDLPGEDFECDDSTDPFFPAGFGGELIEDWWVTRQFGATCDIALEYALSFLPRDAIRAIGQQAFPAELCKPDGLGQCTFDPEPVFVELDGSLTKGCGSLPGNTFTIRFAEPNEPLLFVSKDVPDTPLAVRDVDDDGDLDLITQSADVAQINDGSNAFVGQTTGLPAATLFAADVGDWTDDGNVDLVARSAAGTIVYPGDGAGQFDALSSFVIDSAPTSRLELEDLNGDVLPDAVADTSSSRLIWNQTGGPIAPNFDALSIDPQAVADLDSDGDPDVLSGNDGDPLAVDWAENGGPGNFSTSMLVSVPDGLDAFGDPTQPQELVSLLGQAVYDGVRCEALTGQSTCCEEQEVTGCDDGSCEAIVCDDDPYCCDTEWDSACVAQARSFCGGLCEPYDLECDTTINDVAGEDIDGDGDADLLVAFALRQEMRNNAQDYGAESRWLAWLPNLQIDDPLASGGDPYFDVATESWRLLGRVPAVRDEFDSNDPGPSAIRVVDLDGDLDPDVVAVGLWYRNDAGVLNGPFALHGELTRPLRPDVLFVADLDGDGKKDVVTADRLWEAPEPRANLMLWVGVLGLAWVARTRARAAAASLD